MFPEAFAIAYIVIGLIFALHLRGEAGSSLSFLAICFILWPFVVVITLALNGTLWVFERLDNDSY